MPKLWAVKDRLPQLRHVIGVGVKETGVLTGTRCSRAPRAASSASTPPPTIRR
ncbi:MAG: hypothetical protein M5R42_07700 [Rhodocyclaceae bacterium]|nr:hypothetical protein [Rhodocyclaceae bacterium]